MTWYHRYTYKCIRASARFRSRQIVQKINRIQNYTRGLFIINGILFRHVCTCKNRTFGCGYQTIRDKSTMWINLVVCNKQYISNPITQQYVQISTDPCVIPLTRYGRYLKVQLIDDFGNISEHTVANLRVEIASEYTCGFFDITIK